MAAVTSDVIVTVKDVNLSIVLQQHTWYTLGRHREGTVHAISLRVMFVTQRQWCMSYYNQVLVVKQTLVIVIIAISSFLCR